MCAERLYLGCWVCAEKRYPACALNSATRPKIRQRDAPLLRCLELPWGSLSAVLGLSWDSCRLFLSFFRGCLGPLSGLSGASPGRFLGVSWGCLGLLLGPLLGLSFALWQYLWNYFGPLLGLFSSISWGCLAPLLGLPIGS